MEQKTLETKTNVTKALKDRAANSEVFRAMCEVFALRERTRQQVTVHSLTVKMQKAGHKFTRADYAKELAFLASYGIGSLIKSKTGVIRGLVKIDVTLQSVGQVALSKRVNLDKANIQIRDRRATPRPVKMPSVPKSANQATLILSLDGRKMALDLSPNLGYQELIALIFNIAGKTVEVINERP